jgi:peptide/nickel transport system permease protein
MLLYLARRLVLALALVLALVTVVFFLVHAAPGDPLDRLDDTALDSVQRARIRTQLGLDQPLHVQYWSWLTGVLARGDFGLSLRQHRPVRELIAGTLPNTLLLTVSVYLLHFLTALILGTLMARHRGRSWERTADLAGLAVYSMPVFWLALMAILVFGLRLGWFPVAGASSPDAAWLGGVDRILDRLHHLALPVLVLTASSAVGTARFVRTSVEEALGQDYVLAARARGLPEGAVLWRHALRNGLLPVITMAGLGLPFLLSGAVVIEVVFAWPGMGWLSYTAVATRDYPVVMATTTLAGVLVVAGNLLADVLYGVADPRVRLGGGGRS